MNQNGWFAHSGGDVVGGSSDEIAREGHALHDLLGALDGLANARQGRSEQLDL